MGLQVLRCQGVGLQQFLGRALEHHLATFSSGPRANVHDIVGSQHHIPVVLHHNHRVAQVAQLLQRVNQSFIITLMQTY